MRRKNALNILVHNSSVIGIFYPSCGFSPPPTKNKLEGVDLFFLFPLVCRITVEPKEVFLIGNCISFCPSRTKHQDEIRDDRGVSDDKAGKKEKAFRL